MSNNMKCQVCGRNRKDCLNDFACGNYGLKFPKGHWLIGRLIKNEQFSTGEEKGLKTKVK